MHPDLGKLLCTRYPKMFATDRTGPSHSLRWGLECGDGWFDLIDDLCHQIQTHLDATGGEQIVASQVKEKYGELRFYYDGANDMVEKLVADAEARSVTICEKCGASGRLLETEHGWLRTRCSFHAGEGPAWLTHPKSLPH